MKRTPLVFLATAFLTAPCAALFVEEESQVLSAWGSSAALSAPADTAEWVHRRQAGRSHLRELSGQEDPDIEQAASDTPTRVDGLASSAHKAAVAKTAIQHRTAPSQTHAQSDSNGRRSLVRDKRQAVGVSDVNVAAERVVKQEKLADKIHTLWRKLKETRASATTTAAPHVQVKHATKSQTPVADRYRQQRLAHMKAANATDGKAVSVQAKEVQPSMQAKAKLPKQGVVTKAKVTKVKVTDVTVKEKQPVPKQAARPKQDKVTKAKVTEVKVTDIKVREKVADVKEKEVEPMTKAEQPKQPMQPEVEVNVVAAHAHVSSAEATRTVLSCVCGGAFHQGDRIRYLGHSFPPGRTTGTVIAGTKNGYLNIEWDGFEHGHTGNCALASCGSCSKSSVASRWFTACPDVELEKTPLAF